LPRRNRPFCFTARFVFRLVNRSGTPPLTPLVVFNQVAIGAKHAAFIDLAFHRGLT